MSTEAGWQMIFSDVHGNLEALKAVIEDSKQFSPVRKISLGDVVGYGPKPCECVDLVAQFVDQMVLGNHDFAAIESPFRFNRYALESIIWTKQQLNTGLAGESKLDTKRRWDLLKRFVTSHRDNDLLFVHASPLDTLNDYVFLDDIYKNGRMEALFDRVDRICFQGHTHMPGIFLDGIRGLYGFIPQDNIDDRYPLPSTKAMVNVGSVGKPRDGNTMACYVLFNGTEVLYRRVPYDVEMTIRQIYEIPGLGAETRENLIDRLRRGK
jgi:predicted phosphodiesterase